MPSELIAVVLAAGKGTRMMSDLPKVLVPVLGRPMIEYVLDTLEQAGSVQTIVVVGYRAADVQATLCALTAQSIANAVLSFAPRTAEMLICGGGIHNAELIRQITALLPTNTIASTLTAGLHPDWVEAVAFAWLAKRRLRNLPGNLPSVTGARRAVMLGTIHRPR